MCICNCRTQINTIHKLCVCVCTCMYVCTCMCAYVCVMCVLCVCIVCVCVLCVYCVCMCVVYMCVVCVYCVSTCACVRTYACLYMFVTHTNTHITQHNYYMHTVYTTNYLRENVSPTSRYQCTMQTSYTHCSITNKL